MDNGIFDPNVLPGSQILNDIGKKMQDALDQGTRALTGGKTLSDIGQGVSDAAKGVTGGIADQVGSAVQGVVDNLTSKLGPAFARVALALLALVLIAAAFWLLSNNRKIQLVTATGA